MMGMAMLWSVHMRKNVQGRGNHSSVLKLAKEQAALKVVERTRSALNGTGEIPLPVTPASALRVDPKK